MTEVLDVSQPSEMQATLERLAVALRQTLRPRWSSNT
jgi:hypothetical protein